MTLSEIFAEFICKEPTPDEKAVYLAKKSIIDTMGAMVLGSKSRAARKAEKLAALHGGCTAVGFGTGYSEREAAFINGISGHELELDDTSSSNLGHPTVAVLPSLLALGEKMDISGMELIKAFLIATEIECKTGRIAARSLHERGWHCSSITGVIGAAAGCSYLLKLDREEVVNALGIAASMASGVRENFGTSTKSIHIGKTAEDGLNAALLASVGFKASKTALDGKEGYLFEYTNRTFEPFGDEFAQTLGNDYDICSPGFSIKRYPSCSSSHRAIDALADIIDENGISACDIDKIEIGLGESAIRELVSPYPATGDEAKFSIGFQVALHLLGIDNMPDNYRTDIINKPEIQKIIKATNMYNMEKYNNLPSDMGTGPALARIILKDGRILTRERIYPVGHLSDPITDGAMKDKYLKCTIEILSERKAMSLYDALFYLDDEKKSVKDVMKLSY